MRRPDDWCDTDVEIIRLTDENNKQAEKIKELREALIAVRNDYQCTASFTIQCGADSDYLENSKLIDKALANTEQLK